MPPAEPKAVFISYAVEDAAAAYRICDLLRDRGIEVWLDQSELRGGDAWDTQIRMQIRTCALFVAILSAHTEERAEGYFRREWRLAIERMEDLADDEPFLLPVLIDETRMVERIPARFRERQWAIVDGASESEQEFVGRVERLLATKRPVRRGTLQTGLPRPAGGTRTSIAPIASGAARSTAPIAPPSPLTPTQWLFATRGGLASVLAAFFCINYVETSVETVLQNRLQLGRQWERHLAGAMHAIEGELTFEGQDTSGLLAVYAASAAYFFVFPLLVAGLLLALGCRRQLAGCRLAVLAVTLTYALSLPFFVFFPVPERWAYPEADAILLSDRWTSALIDAFRPFSGINNSFPSFHVSCTMTIILLAFRLSVRQRYAVLFLGLGVIASTFVLGTHWLPDIAAGIALAVIAVALAERIAGHYFVGPPESWPPIRAPLGSTPSTRTPQASGETS